MRSMDNGVHCPSRSRYCGGILAAAAGWHALGGCELFRLYDTPDAEQAQARLARHRIWSRIFPYSNRWLRLGLPGGDLEWARLTQALEG